jgi:hypothetical protein
MKYVAPATRLTIGKEVVEAKAPATGISGPAPRSTRPPGAPEKISAFTIRPSEEPNLVPILEIVKEKVGVNNQPTSGTFQLAERTGLSMPLIDTIIAAFPGEAPVARARASQNNPLLKEVWFSLPSPPHLPSSPAWLFEFHRQLIVERHFLDNPSK